MTPVPSAASASLPGSVIPSPSTSPPSRSPIASANLWPVFFAPLAVVLPVLLILAVAIIVYCKQRRKYSDLKPQASKGFPEDDSGIEKHKGWFISFHSLQGDQITNTVNSNNSHNSVVC